MLFSRTFVQILFLAALSMLGTGIYLRQMLPQSTEILNSAHQEPLQTGTGQKPFIVTREGVNYTVKPMAHYEITGVVVSRHDTAAWWDWIHAATNDHLNVVDLCIVWGNNVKNDNYRQLKYSSGQWTCTVSTNSDQIWRAFDENALSNNHILTENPALAKKLKNIKIGDQVSLKGYLAEYSHNTGTSFTRGTSLVRNDRGDGACETIYVRDVQVLRKTAALPSTLRWLGALLAVLASIVWVWFTPLIDQD